MVWCLKHRSVGYNARRTLSGGVGGSRPRLLCMRDYRANAIARRLWADQNFTPLGAENWPPSGDFGVAVRFMVPGDKQGGAGLVGLVGLMVQLSGQRRNVKCTRWLIQSPSPSMLWLAR